MNRENPATASPGRPPFHSAPSSLDEAEAERIWVQKNQWVQICKEKIYNGIATTKENPHVRIHLIPGSDTSLVYTVKWIIAHGRNRISDSLAVDLLFPSPTHIHCGNAQIQVLRNFYYP